MLMLRGTALIHVEGGCEYFATGDVLLKITGQDRVLEHLMTMLRTLPVVTAT